jgi:cytoskeleton protein RodZ
MPRTLDFPHAVVKLNSSASRGTGSGAIVAIGGHVTEVSARLRAARERAGLTIQDVSASTRIRPASLEAIERGDFAALPGNFYTRAFLRTYASFLGLSPQAVVDEYDADRHQPQPIQSAPPAWQTSARRVSSQLAAAATSTGVVIALVVGLLALAIARNKPDAQRPSAPVAVGTSGTGGAPEPARSSQSAPTAIESPQTLTIDIQADAPLWVTGAADGKRVLYRLLAPGERVSIKAANTLAFRVGDASAFTYSINGVPGKPIGGAGEVRDLEITRQNFRSFKR